MTSKESFVAIASRDLQSPLARAQELAKFTARQASILIPVLGAKVLFSNIREASTIITKAHGIDYRAWDKLENFSTQHIFESVTGYSPLAQRAIVRPDPTSTLTRLQREAVGAGQYIFNTKIQQEGEWFTVSTDKFTPSQLAEYLLLLPSMWVVDVGMRYLSQNKNNHIANLYNRPWNELNLTRQVGRITIDGLIVSATVGSIAGVINGINC